MRLRQLEAAFQGCPLPPRFGGASRAAQSMPLMGAQLSSSDLDAVAAYVWALGHRSGH
jgi:mono/diheme cytochrome c family protein